MLAAVLILYVVSLLLLWYFVFYPLFCAVLAQRKTALNTLKAPAELHTPSVSVIVPTFNEAAVIGARIDNLLDLTYPDERYEIIVVDSQSTDETTAIVEKRIANFGPDSLPQLTLLQTGEREGKAAAINFAMACARGEILVIADANATYHASALTALVAPFADARVGVVGGRYLVQNAHDTLPSLESIYWDVEHIKKIGESELDSASGVIGGLSAWRRDNVSFREDRLAEDLDACVTRRKNGLTIRYEPNAIVYEPAATTISEQIQQRRRVGQGIIQVLVAHWRYLLLPRDRFAFIFCSHWTLSLMSPFFLIAVLVLYAIIGDPAAILEHLSITIVAAIVGFFAFLRVTSSFDVKTQRPQKLGVRALPGAIAYILLNEYLILLAWSDAIRRRDSVLWEKAHSTRNTGGLK
jgi:poly-beta-1,6-N-acetyl-D-glucosamine synthase